MPINITLHSILSNTSKHPHFMCPYWTDIWNECCQSWNKDWQGSAGIRWLVSLPLVGMETLQARLPLSPHKSQDDWLQVPASFHLEGSWNDPPWLLAPSAKPHWRSCRTAGEYLQRDFPFQMFGGNITTIAFSWCSVSTDWLLLS